MTDQLTSLLEQGFSLQYTPDIVTLQQQQAEIVSTVQAIVGEQSTVQTASALVRQFTALAQRADAVVQALATEANAPHQTVDLNGTTVTVLTTDQYLAITRGSPDLTQINQARLFEAEHLGPTGNLNVFVYEDALRLRAAMQQVLETSALTTLSALNGTLNTTQALDPSNPITSILEYYRIKAAFAESAISAVETTAQLPNQVVSLTESQNITGLGADTGPAPYTQQLASFGGALQSLLTMAMPGNPLATAANLIQCAGQDHNMLGMLRAALLMLQALMESNVYGDIEELRNYAMRQAMTSLNSYAAEAVSKVYAAVIQPIVTELQTMDQQGTDFLGDILRRVQQVNPQAATTFNTRVIQQMYEHTFQAVFKQVYGFQHYLVELTQEDQTYFNAHAGKSAKIADLKQLHWTIQYLDRAIALLDQAAASGNMSQFIEAYAANAVMQPLAQDYTNMVQQNAAFTTAVAQQTQVNQIADAYNPLTAAGRQNIVNAMSATDPNLYATLANGGPLVPSAEAQQAQGVLDNWLSTGATRAQVAATVLAQNGIPTPLQQEEAVMTANTVPSTHP